MQKLDNNQLLHIGTEVIVLGVAGFYLNKKYKSLISYVDTLKEKIEEQDELLNKHEEVIVKLVELVNELKSSVEKLEEQEVKEAFVPPGMVQGMPPGMVQGMPPGMVQGMPPGMVQGMPPGMVQGMPPGMREMMMNVKTTTSKTTITTSTCFQQAKSIFQR